MPYLFISREIVVKMGGCSGKIPEGVQPLAKGGMICMYVASSDPVKSGPIGTAVVMWIAYIIDTWLQI